ncbi:histidine-rich glycoprotein-like [Phymastichus coffea]|uniref:histidine-rich glycoprotein-like n=1 Tax=Phymastichus coffea TaxID=108790 RepID=UPI00273BC225|nr:histidine-rich glycoprotein-like [Phymastichus coffea]
MKFFIVLLAIVAAVSAFPGYEHHEAEHHHVIQVPQPHPIPPLHPKPLHLKVHDESVKLHYDYPHVHHPKLIGYEVQHHHEPEIHPVHGHGHHSW